MWGLTRLFGVICDGLDNALGELAEDLARILAQRMLSQVARR